MRCLSRLTPCVVALLLLTGGTAVARHRSSVLTCVADADCIGTGRSDILTVPPEGTGDNIIDGRGGKDIITGAGDGDLLRGGRGRDIINGGGGDVIDSRDRKQDLVNCLEDDVIGAFDSRDIVSGPCEFDPTALDDFNND